MLPGWLAGLIVAVVLFLVAGVLALLGKKDVRQAAPPLPTETIASVQADIDTVKQAISGDARHRRCRGRLGSDARRPPARRRRRLKAEIDATREQLGRTVDELSARLDVPARAKERAARTRDTAVETYRESPPLVIAAAVALVGLCRSDGVAPEACNSERGETLSKGAKLAYRPIGLIGGIPAGVVSGAIFKQVWKVVAREDDAPERCRASTR